MNRLKALKKKDRQHINRKYRAVEAIFNGRSARSVAKENGLSTHNITSLFGAYCKNANSERYDELRRKYDISFRGGGTATATISPLLKDLIENKEDFL